MSENNKQKLLNFVELINQQLGTDIPYYDHPSNKISEVADPLVLFKGSKPYIEIIF